MSEPTHQSNFHVDLSGKTALVTGAGSGIGLAIAQALAQSGAHVLLNDVAPERAQAAAEALQAEPLPGDITDPDFVAVVRDRECDILVNNAGFQHVAPIETFPPDVFRRMLEVMLVGPFLLSQTVVPGMKRRGFGRILNIGSVHSKIASANKTGYVAAKHGVLGLTRALALETAPHGITVNAICPGYVDTPLVRNQLEDLARTHQVAPEAVLPDVVLRPVPLKRLLAPEEIASLALFLCSDAAAAITAQGYTMDGGW